MARSSASLSTSLQSISATTEAETITAWGHAMADYFAGAVAGSAPGVAFTTNPTHITTAKAAVAAAMSGMCTSGQAATKVQAGIVAWWAALAASPSNYFTGAASVTAPTGITSIAANLPAAFEDNKLELTKAAACNRLATLFHDAQAGGSANISGAQTIS